MNCGEAARAVLILICSLCLFSCAGDERSPGVPDSVLDGSMDKAHRIELGENRIDYSPAKVTVMAEMIGCKKSRLDALTISVSGTKVRCEPAMIAPLIDPHWIRIAAASNRIYVSIDGGDASGSYTAVFTVVSGRIAERLIAQGEFHHEVWERTIYHNDFAQHPDWYKNM